MKRIVLVAGLVAILVLPLVLVGCGPQKISLEIEMTDFAFKPADISVPAGAEITLTLTNKGKVEHDWALMKAGKKASTPFRDHDNPDIYVEQEAKAGATETKTFTAPSKPGEYQIVCTEPGHLEAGMKGKLTVTKQELSNSNKPRFVWEKTEKEVK